MLKVNPGTYNEDPESKYKNYEDSYSDDYKVTLKCCHLIQIINVLQVNDVKVDFAHHENHKTYTVEAKAGDFIIGEVGRINVNNGQTLEVSHSQIVLSISDFFLPRE